MGLVTWLIGVIFLVLVLPQASRYLVNFIRFRIKVKKLPQSPCHFLLGNLWDITLVPAKEYVETAGRILARSPPLSLIWLGTYPFIQIHHPKHIEVILGSVQHIDKPMAYTFLQPWLGTGLLTSTGSKWHSHRKMLTPAFHFTILENFVEVFAKKGEILVKKLQKEIGAEKFDIYPYITTCALDIICETAMGVEINAQEQQTHSDYVEAVLKITFDVMNRVLCPWLYPNFTFMLSSSGRRFKKYVRRLHNFTNKVIQERKKHYANVQNEQMTQEDLQLGKRKKMTFLDLLLETAQNGENLTDEDIREEVDTFMFEGHDTTTAAISWALYLLANHPDVQEKVYEELESVFEGSDHFPTLKELNELKYLERVIKEALRLYPSVPVIMRHLKEDVEIDGHLVPATMDVTIFIYFTHRLPEYYPDPEKFNPDNFLPERIAARHPYAYIPFSAGPRNCIGQKFAILEEKTVLSYVLRHYKFHATDHVPDYVPELILRPENGIKLRITPRRNSSS